MKLFSKSFVVGLALLGVAESFAGLNWSRDDTFDLLTDIKAIRDSNGTINRLPARTYWVRGQIRIAPSNSDSTAVASNKLYSLTMPFATEEDPYLFQIWGAEPDSQGNPTTRIVHGVVAHPARFEDELLVPADWSHYNALPASDPWKARFPSGSQNNIRWIDVPVGHTFYDHRTHTAKSANISGISMQNIPTLSFNGLAMKVASSMVDATINDPTHRWSRVDENSGANNYEFTCSSFNAIPLPTNNTSDPGYDPDAWKHTWVQCFAQNDYEPIQAPLKWISHPTTSSTKFEFFPTATFWHNPSDPDSPPAAGTFNGRQRFSVVNSPEFLNSARTFVFRPFGGPSSPQIRIYFILSTVAPLEIETVSLGYDPEATNVGLEIGMPWVAPQTTDKILGWPISISGDKSSFDEYNSVVIKPQDGLNKKYGVDIRDLTFGTGRSTALRVDFMGAQNQRIDNCDFRGFGQSALTLNRTINMQVKNCNFKGALRGHVYYNAGSNTSGFDENAPIRDEIFGLTDENIFLKDSVIKDSGSLWPDVAVLLENFHIGTDVTGCTFQTMGGAGLRVKGAKNIVSGNNFLETCLDVTDMGALYIGKSWIQIGNLFKLNSFQGMKPRGGTTGSLSGDVAAIMLDDYQCGTRVESNNITDCQTGIISNGGRFNHFLMNSFSGVTGLCLRTQVSRAAEGPMREFFPGNWAAHLAPNHCYIEFRAVYEKFAGSNNTNIYGQSAWLALQSLGAYAIPYPSPSVAGPHYDLKLLADRLSAYDSAWYTDVDARKKIAGYTKTWVNNAWVYVITDDWFRIANSGSSYLEPFLIDFGTGQTKLSNTFNVFSWNAVNFQNGSQNPTQGTIPSHFFVKSLDPYASILANDPKGYYAKHVIPAD